MQINYNPDVLSCLANLSNDEVFTSPNLANQILDLLPEELWRNKEAKFLDPVCKSGVFLREIAKRLMLGLEKQMPNQQKRINHIFKNQLFGIAITEITSLLSRRSVYCSKTANGKYSICDSFNDEQGNIIFNSIKHNWKNKKCIYCNANQAEYERSKELETHAYQFIHTDKPQKIFNNMKFDVIIGNPPYQLNDGGGVGTSAIPIYHKFILQAIKLNPRYLCMIVPSRWFSGGKGLDEFRNKMLKDNRISQIHDYIDASDIFPGVQIKGGVNYFLWEKEHTGHCKVITYRNGEAGKSVERPLQERGSEIFIRYNEAISILRKVQKFKEPIFEKNVSARKPFGIDSNFEKFMDNKTESNKIKLYRNGPNGYINSKYIKKNLNLVKRIKVIISKAGSGSDSFPHQILGVPIISEINSVCTETYLIIGVFDDIKQAQNLISYVKTLFFRFLVSLIKNTQNAARSVYAFVPVQDYRITWDDEKLFNKYNLNQNEINFIESIIRPISDND